MRGLRCEGLTVRYRGERMHAAVVRKEPVRRARCRIVELADGGSGGFHDTR